MSISRKLKASESRSKKSDKYKEQALTLLRKYTDMTAAQIYDRIKEDTDSTELDVKERAFRNYISSLQEEYEIKNQNTLDSMKLLQIHRLAIRLRWIWGISSTHQDLKATMIPLALIYICAEVLIQRVRIRE